MEGNNLLVSWHQAVLATEGRRWAWWWGRWNACAWYLARTGSEAGPHPPHPQPKKRELSVWIQFQNSKITRTSEFLLQVNGNNVIASKKRETRRMDTLVWRNLCSKIISMGHVVQSGSAILKLYNTQFYKMFRESSQAHPWAPGQWLKQRLLWFISSPLELYSISKNIFWWENIIMTILMINNIDN